MRSAELDLSHESIAAFSVGDVLRKVASEIDFETILQGAAHSDNVLALSGTSLGESFRDLLELRLLSRGDVDVSAVLDESRRHHLSEPRSTARDDGDLAFDVEEVRDREIVHFCDCSGCGVILRRWSEEGTWGVTG